MSRHTCSEIWYSGQIGSKLDVRALAHGRNSKANVCVLTKRERHEHEVYINAQYSQKAKKVCIVHEVTISCSAQGFLE